MTNSNKKVTVIGRNVDGSPMNFTFGMTVFAKAHAIARGGSMAGFGVVWSGVDGESKAWATSVQHAITAVIQKEYGFRGGKANAGPMFTVEEV